VRISRPNFSNPSSGPVRANRRDAVTLLASPSHAGLRISGQRTAAAGIAAVALANLRVPGRPATLCPFRAITGIPCPFCGGTTAAVRIGHLDLLGALRANPVVVIGAVFVLALPVLKSAPAVVAFRSASPRVTKWTLIGAIVLAIAFSEVWQLFRFGLL
jgi:Protein of unknown function (DUF2752)